MHDCLTYSAISDMSSRLEFYTLRYNFRVIRSTLNCSN